MAKKTFTPVQQVFEDADNNSVSYMERLLALGIATRAEAKPHAMEWASIKYEAKIIDGRQGKQLPRDTPAVRAMNRVLATCFPSVDKPSTVKANKTDPVKQLVAKYSKLTKAEQRRFLSSI
jgi:hypothetical protein